MFRGEPNEKARGVGLLKVMFAEGYTRRCEQKCRRLALQLQMVTAFPFRCTDLSSEATMWLWVLLVMMSWLMIRLTARTPQWLRCTLVETLWTLLLTCVQTHFPPVSDLNSLWQRFPWFPMTGVTRVTPCLVKFATTSLVTRLLAQRITLLFAMGEQVCDVCVQSRCRKLPTLAIALMAEWGPPPAAPRLTVIMGSRFATPLMLGCLTAFMNRCVQAESALTQ